MVFLFKKKKADHGMRHVLPTTFICNLYLNLGPLRFETPILTST